MKKFVTGFVIVALIVMTAGYNLGKNSHSEFINQSQSDAQLLDNQEMAETEGGMRLRCLIAVAIAGAAAGSGVGLPIAIILGAALACACDEELDEIFGTNFVEACGGETY